MLRFLRSSFCHLARTSRVTRRPVRQALRLEALETRLLPSLTAHLLSVINPTGNSNPGFFGELDQGVFLPPDAMFSASDGVHGQELWISDGTSTGTHMVQDINTGPASSYPSFLTTVDHVVGFLFLTSTVFFTADDGIHGRELWRSDGTAAGTQLVLDINPGSAGSDPAYLTNVNGALFFTADDGTNGRQLWRSDGTASGTSVVTPGPFFGNPNSLTNFNGTLFFSATDVFHGMELWRTDGTANGTTMVGNINSVSNGAIGDNGSYPAGLTNVSGTLFFEADDGIHGHELWRSDGTGGGTTLVADINPGSGDSYPGPLTNLNGTLLFSADDGSDGVQLWRSDGTSAGTTMVTNLNPAPGHSSYPGFPGGMINFNGTLFFSALNDLSGTELWRSDGTFAGTRMVADINPGPNDSFPNQLTDLNGLLVFAADDSTNGSELWQTDGTAAGTSLVEDINRGGGGSYPGALTNIGGMLFFSADDGFSGKQLWTVQDNVIDFLGASSNPSVAGQTVTFTAFVRPSDPHYFSAMPTGSITFAEGATMLAANVPLNSMGEATFTTASLSAGTHVLLAESYSGDRTFAPGGASSPFVQTVNRDATTSTVSSSPHGAAFGQTVTFTDTVAAKAPGSGTPIGAVTFKEGSTILASGMALIGGKATFTTSSLSVASHTITAVYSGDSNFTGSQGDDSASPEAVNAAMTSTAITCSPSPSMFSQAVTLTASVRVQAPGSGTPVGNVSFFDNSQDLGPSVSLNQFGQATFRIPALSVGTHTMTASYRSTSANFGGSQGSVAEIVKKAPTRAVLTAFPAPAVFGQVVSFTVAVSDLLGNVTPTGTVTFTDGSATIGTVPLNLGRGTSTTASLSRGNHAISANYSGDGNFLTSAYMNFGENVLKDTTTTTVTASANPAVVGHPVTFTATAQANAPGSGTPTGTVTFRDITTVLGTGTLNAAGRATFSTSALAVGTHAITATYSGDNNFVTSMSPIVAEVVKSTPSVTTSSFNLSETGPAIAAPLPSVGTSSRASGPQFFLVTGLSAQDADALFVSRGNEHPITLQRVRPRVLVLPEDAIEF
jgi:ELWxxDGT repeat protein